MCVRKGYVTYEAEIINEPDSFTILSSPTIIYFLRKYKFSLDCIISRYRRYLKTKFCMLNKHASINYKPPLFDIHFCVYSYK